MYCSVFEIVYYSLLFVETYERAQRQHRMSLEKLRISAKRVNHKENKMKEKEKKNSNRKLLRNGV